MRMGMRVLLVAFVLMPVLAQLPALIQDKFEVTGAPTTSQRITPGTRASTRRSGKSR